MSDDKKDHWSTEVAAAAVAVAVTSVAGDVAGEAARVVVAAALENEKVVETGAGGWEMVRGRVGGGS